MKKFFLLLIFISKVGAQEYDIDTTRYKRCKIEYGMLIPLGNLKTKFETSHELGFWFRTRIAHNDMMDFGFRLNLPSNPKEFNYQGNDSIFKLKTKGLNGVVGIRMNKIVHLNKDISLEWSTSIGYCFFIFDDLEGRLYDKRNPPSPEQIENDKKNKALFSSDNYSKALSSLYLGQGFTLNYKLVGLHCNYNFTPYSWFLNRIDKDFGASSLSINLFRKF